MADTDSIGGNKDRQPTQLRANRTEQPSQNCRFTDPAERPKIQNWWHTDPAELGNAAMLHAQGCTDGSGQGEFGRTGKRSAQDEKNGTAQPFVGRVANGVAFTMDEHGKVVNDSSHGNKLTTETRSESDETCQELQPMLNIGGEAASSPQGQGQGEQRPEQLAEAMPEMPRGDSCESWGLGAWKNEIETNGVQDLRHVIHSDSLSLNQKQFIVWLAAMRGREWAAECFEAMGQTPRVAHGVKDRVNRLKAIGNGQVPLCAAVAFRILSQGLA